MGEEIFMYDGKREQAWEMSTRQAAAPFARRERICLFVGWAIVSLRLPSQHYSCSMRRGDRIAEDLPWSKTNGKRDLINRSTWKQTSIRFSFFHHLNTGRSMQPYNVPLMSMKDNFFSAKRSFHSALFLTCRVAGCLLMLRHCRSDHQSSSIASPSQPWMKNRNRPAVSYPRLRCRWIKRPMK